MWRKLERYAISIYNYYSPTAHFDNSYLLDNIIA